MPVTAGRYYIVNRVQNPSDQALAITFNGNNAFATVTPYSPGNQNQQWQVIDFNASTQSVSPASNTALQISFGANNGAFVRNAGGFVWIINSNSDGVTMQDGNQTVYWGLNTATNNEIVGLNPQACAPAFGQRWYLQAA